MAIVKIKVRRLTNYIGAEVSGLDLSKGLTRDDAAFLRQTWIDNAVLVIPGQELPPKQFAAFAQIFGEILPPPIAKFSVEDCPEVGTISSKDLPVIDGKLHVRGEKSHTDYSNFKEPPQGHHAARDRCSREGRRHVVRRCPSAGRSCLLGQPYARSQARRRSA